jgi:hypothetical protein
MRTMRKPALRITNLAAFVSFPSRRDGQREAPGEGNIARGTMEPCHDLALQQKGLK